MASRDSIVKDLLDKLQHASTEELSEVVDFADFLRARRLKQAAAGAALDELEAQAAAAGLLRLPDPQARKLSTTEAPPIAVGGKPASEVVLEDRR
jgi:FAD/FMN-containing dehydrogenase